MNNKADDTIWHDWDAFRQVLKVAFVGEGGISVFTYRLCVECGVSMDKTESADETVWTCPICGSEVLEV